MLAVSGGFYRSPGEHGMCCDCSLLWQLLLGSEDCKNVCTAGRFHYGGIKKEQKYLMSRVKNPFIGVIVFLSSIYSVSDCFSFLADENTGIYQLHKAPQNPVETLQESTSSAGDLQIECNLIFFVCAFCIIRFYRWDTVHKLIRKFFTHFL